MYRNQARLFPWLLNPCADIHKNGAPSAATAAAAGQNSDAEAGRANASSLVKLRQKAFLKRVVELGLRRRPKEVLGLMEDTKREGFPPFNIYM